MRLPSEYEISCAPRYKPGLVVEPMIDSFGKEIPGFFIFPEAPQGLLAWLAGGYNLPSEAEG